MIKKSLGLLAALTMLGTGGVALAGSASATGTPTITPLPANPLTSINCVLPTTVVPTPASTSQYTFQPVVNHIALNGRIGTTVVAKPGYAFPGGVLSKAFAATPSQTTLAQPTVVNGVPVYGASTCGTWKVGSKVTLTEGSEFSTHGGTSVTGPVTRYRLVFTPNAGFNLPTTLPGDGYKVGNSAVFLVYVVAPYEVKLSDASGRVINLPDVFDIEHTEYAEGTYWATKVKLLVTNDTNTPQNFNIRYADVQDGDRVWVERAIFTDGLPTNVVPAHSSRPMTLDVWHNVVSGADVPDDLTLSFGFELG